MVAPPWVTDEYGWAIDPTQRAFHGGHVIRIAVEPVLDGDHFVTIGLQGGNHLAEARTVGPETMAETMEGLVLVDM